MWGERGDIPHILALLQKGDLEVFQRQPSLLMSGRMNISSQDDISHFSDPARPFLCSLVLVMEIDAVRPSLLNVLPLAWEPVSRERREGVSSAGIRDAFIFLSGWMPKMLD